MKKFATLIAASALTLGGAVVAPSGAVAADPYPQTVATSCAVITNTPVRQFKVVRARVSWTSAGNARPRGTILVKVIRRKTGQVVRGATRGYYGKPRAVRFMFLKPGAYRIRVQGITPANSVFKGCTARAFVRVKRR